MIFPVRYGNKLRPVEIMHHKGCKAGDHKHRGGKDQNACYTGYNKEEILDKLDIIKSYQNIIIKYGRYIPGQKKHFDSELGVYLASDNQYAERI